MREEIKEEKDLKVVTELEYRIANKSDADANKAARTMAISWEQFFMGIAELSKTRPGEEKNPKIIVKIAERVFPLDYHQEPIKMSCCYSRFKLSCPSTTPYNFLITNASNLKFSILAKRVLPKICTNF
ncbi:PREDICTED: uncharacterized protein LOC109589906 [Amphimedon queenslandica]|uniref:Uncharacterized protein n=1 Tax=Amphimedon queenslandica TaxID=400682 RepID=A0AAN0JWA2_AMPQE|nr:PREDICTED: uncharacterized protein LOC109589906 [Amphimedon queenslandica]|eukprot:XP_019861448.1 PREDICTED: uncharacterized protein LOC109589906 [Amphimedon queenslandica]